MQKLISVEKKSDFETQLRQHLEQGWRIVAGTMVASSLTTFEAVEKPRHERRASLIPTPLGFMEMPPSNYPEWANKIISTNFFACVVERTDEDERRAKQEAFDRFFDTDVATSSGLTTADCGTLRGREITTRRRLFEYGLGEATKLLKTYAAQRRLKAAYDWISRQHEQLRVGL